MLISKTKDSFPTIGRHRPISINSFPLRVAEKVIQEALKNYKTCHIKFDRYQTGFTEGGDPHFNIIKVIKHLKTRKGY
jgi:hypothetical protein